MVLPRSCLNKMSKQQIFDAILKTLNEAFEADPYAFSALVNSRVPCNANLANHPTIQVHGTPESYAVGPMGLINGIVEKITGKRIACLFSTPDRTCPERGEQRLLGFIEYKPDKSENTSEALPPSASSVLAEIEAEIARATAKFPTWPTDPIHAFAVVGEEYGECQKEVLQLTYEPHKSSKEEVRKEAVQLAAMAIRFLMSLDRYEYAPLAQHSQHQTRSMTGEERKAAHDLFWACDENRKECAKLSEKEREELLEEGMKVFKGPVFPPNTKNTKMQDDACRGILGWLFGHKYRPRYTEESSLAPEFYRARINSPHGESASDILEAAKSRKKGYIHDVCTRCGKTGKIISERAG
jgi:hypothetical protein